MSTASATAVDTAAAFHLIDTDMVDKSSLNYRSEFAKDDMADIIASVKLRGIIQPLTVRPHPTKGKGHYEVVAGDKRRMAAVAAKLAQLPCMVRDVDDKEARQISLIENLQRKDPHPLDEADGFHELTAAPNNLTVEEIAKQISKSVEYVFTRLKLRDLGDVGRKALHAGKLSYSTAVLVARIPDEKLQAEAVKGMTQYLQNGDGPMPFLRASAFVRDRFMLRLVDAPFNTKDATLVPKAGACDVCPKRSGAQPQLFADVGKADLCTDPDCFAEKKDAKWKADQAKAKETGATVLPDAKAKDVFYADGALRAADFVDLSAKCTDDKKKRTFKQILGDDVPVVVARDDRGKVHLLVKASDAKPALKAAGVKVGGEARAQVQHGVSSAALEKRKLVNEGRRAAMQQIAERATAGKVSSDLALWRFLASGFLEGSWNDVLTAVAKRRGWEPPASAKFGKGPAAVQVQVDKLGTADLRGLVVEIIATRDAFSANMPAELFNAAAKLCGVDASKQLAEVQAAARDRAKQAKKKTAAKGKR